MSKPDWKDAPEGATHARFWLGQWHWFKHSPNFVHMWQKFEHGKWWLTCMNRAVEVYLERRP